MATATTIRLTRECSGNYRYEGTRYTFFVQRVISDYGDAQWVTDAVSREPNWTGACVTEYFQTDTLAGARATIARLEKEVTA